MDEADPKKKGKISFTDFEKLMHEIVNTPSENDILESRKNQNIALANKDSETAMGEWQQKISQMES